MKGWRTIAIAIATLILGGVQTQTFKEAVGGCIFTTDAIQPDTCAFPPSVIMAISALMIGLRLFTTTSAFKKD